MYIDDNRWEINSEPMSTRYSTMAVRYIPREAKWEIGGACCDFDPSITWYEHTVPWISFNYTLSILRQGRNWPLSVHSGLFWNTFKVILYARGPLSCILHPRIGPLIRQCLRSRGGSYQHFSERSLYWHIRPSPNLSQVPFCWLGIVPAYYILAAFHLSLRPFIFNNSAWMVFVHQINQDCNKYY